MGKIEFRKILGLVKSAIYSADGLQSVGVTGGRLDVNATVSPGVPGIPVTSYAQITGIFNTEALIVSYTVPGGTTFSFSGLNLGGQADGEFIVYVNSVAILIFRNSAANRTQYLPMADTVKALAGDIIDIKVTNCNYRQNSALYEATLTGAYA